LGGGEPVVFIAAIQLPYLRSIATLTPLAVASGADRARDRAEALRERVAALLTTGSVDAELALLDPLFERFDPAEVAAALLALQRAAGAGCLLDSTGSGSASEREAAPRGTMPVPSPTTHPTVPAQRLPRRAHAWHRQEPSERRRAAQRGGP